jgi:Uma2 family endonuclease
MAEPALKEPPGETRARMSLEAFLAWDDGTDVRHELVRGEVRAMAPTVVAHADIVSNLTGELRQRLETPCRGSSGAGIVPPDRDDTFYIPDLVVDCARREPGQRYLEEPRVIVEVLSDSTADRDRRAKLPDYRTIPSIEAILLVEARRRQIELWQRQGDRWLVQDLLADADEIVIDGLDLRLPLAAVYEGVALAEPERAAG